MYAEIDVDDEVDETVSASQERMNFSIISKNLKTITTEWQREIAEVKNNHLLRIPTAKTTISEELHTLGIEKINVAKAALHEALMHFNLLELNEVGLENDEFLSEHWQSRSEHERSTTHTDDGADDLGIDSIDSEVPHRIKHYVRKKSKEFFEANFPGHTPGATLPELSNPGAQGSSASHDWGFGGAYCYRCNKARMNNKRPRLKCRSH